jgi:CubicO group peptidase (beta-lactamase class C family)
MSPASLEEVAREACAAWSSKDGPGMAVGVLSGGDVIFADAYGMADLESGYEMVSDSICYTGSVSKQFTACAVLLAALDGHLGLDDPLRKWVPEVPEWADAITVDHLLHHTAGLRDYFGYLALQGRLPDADFDPHSMLGDLNRQHRLNFPPGERFVYSNTNYVLLTMIVERATGVAFADYAKRRIFEPMKMKDTLFLAGERLRGERAARAYKRSTAGGWELDDPVLGVVGDGGMRSTVPDLLLWADACMTGALDTRLMDHLAERGRLNDGRLLTYARGVAYRQRGGRASIQHGGGLGGWRAALVWFPEERVALAVLANAAEADPVLAALTLADVLLPGTLPEPAPASPVSDRFFGRWIDREQGLVIEIASRDGGTALEIWGQRLVLSGDGHNRAVSSRAGVVVEANSEQPLTIDVSEAGDRLGRFEPAPSWDPGDADAYAGSYRSAEFPDDWTLAASGGSLKVAHLPDETFRPAVPGVFVSGATSLSFPTHGSPQRFLLNAARTGGFEFESVEQ